LATSGAQTSGDPADSGESPPTVIMVIMMTRAATMDRPVVLPVMAAATREVPLVLPVTEATRDLPVLVPALVLMDDKLRFSMTDMFFIYALHTTLAVFVVWISILQLYISDVPSSPLIHP